MRNGYVLLLHLAIMHFTSMCITFHRFMICKAFTFSSVTLNDTLRVPINIGLYKDAGVRMWGCGWGEQPPDNN